MTGIKNNNNNQSFGLPVTTSRFNYHTVTQSNQSNQMTNKTNYLRYKDQSVKVSTTKNSSSQMSSPVAIRSAMKQRTSPIKESSTRYTQTKVVNTSNFDKVNKRFASLNPRDTAATGYGTFKGMSNLNTTEQSKKNIRESREMSN
jgi:hypothetical protein